MTTNTILLIIAAVFFALVAALGVWLMARAYYRPQAPYQPLPRERKTRRSRRKRNEL
jgi:hypothetical protein